MASFRASQDSRTLESGADAAAPPLVRSRWGFPKKSREKRGGGGEAGGQTFVREKQRIHCLPRPTSSSFSDFASTGCSNMFADPSVNSPYSPRSHLSHASCTRGGGVEVRL
jgi:hypothetical protein